MSILMMRDGKFLSQHLHEPTIEFAHQLYFFVMVQILIHLLLIKFLQVHKNGIVQFLYHKAIFGIFAFHQSQQNLLMLQDIQISVVLWTAREEASLYCSAYELFHCLPYWEFLEVDLVLHLYVFAGYLEVEFDEFQVDGTLWHVRICHQHEFQGCIESFDWFEMHIVAEYFVNGQHLLVG